jgi:hypothetical protein
MPATYIDNIQILKAIDERQQQMNGRPLHQNARQLLNEMSGAYAADPVLTPGFLQELFIAQAAGHLNWRIYGREPNPISNPDYYLQQVQELELTPEGQDRARGRMVERPAPMPGEDDGHDLSDLIRRQVADAIATEYDPDQVVTFLGEQGIPPDWLELPEQTDPADARAVLAACGERAPWGGAWSGSSWAAGSTGSSSRGPMASCGARSPSSSRARAGRFGSTTRYSSRPGQCGASRSARRSCARHACTR